MHLILYTALQYVKDNIRINGTARALVNTESLENIRRNRNRLMIGESQHNRKMFDPEENAYDFLFLCSDQARSITRITIPVDGDFSIS